MRLTQEEQISIRQVILNADPDAKIWLFGSRVDDNARGGDIDLLIFSERPEFVSKLAYILVTHWFNSGG